MLTLEVNGKFITWPEDFAMIMAGYYKKHDILVIAHKNGKQYVL
jgi:hypothetical protein